MYLEKQESKTTKLTLAVLNVSTKPYVDRSVLSAVLKIIIKYTVLAAVNLLAPSSLVSTNISLPQRFTKIY